MKLRVWSNMSYIELDVDENFNFNDLLKALDEGQMVCLKTKEDTDVILNAINILAIEVIHIPPISEKK